MELLDLTTFLTAQAAEVGPIFLAGFGTFMGIALVRGAVLRWGGKLRKLV